MKKNKFTIYIAVVAFLFVLSIACGSSESDQFSTSTEFDIVIDGGNLVGDVDTLRTVSYTHLTLPTILLV